MRLFIFGYGFTGQALSRRLAPRGWTITATVRRPDDAARLEADGVTALGLDQTGAIADAVDQADAVLLTAPPDEAGCPALAHLGPVLTTARPGWTGYLSTTGVYGDHGGGWVFETSPTTPRSVEGARRVEAEQGWTALTDRLGLDLAIFRLPGIYGPGRSALDRLRAGKARRIVSAGQVFSRIHVEDLASGLAASMAAPRRRAIYNLCDDEPAPNAEVIAYAAGLLGIEPPLEIPLAEANLGPAALRFYAESKRVSNARAKAELGWRPRYRTYREGLTAILAAGG